MSKDNDEVLVMKNKKGVVGKERSLKSPPMLPPCRVCGEKASGLHYGVNTCEACKAFFRRNLQRGAGYRCLEDNKCLILPGKRSSCSACRFNKCLALGMCKEAIKTGRYTHEKRTEDIMEVKRLSQQLQQQQLQQHQQQQQKHQQHSQQLQHQQRPLQQQKQQQIINHSQQFSPRLLSPPLSSSSLSSCSPVVDNMDCSDIIYQHQQQHHQHQQNLPSYKYSLDIDVNNNNNKNNNNNNNNKDNDNNEISYEEHSNVNFFNYTDESSNNYNNNINSILNTTINNNNSENNNNDDTKKSIMASDNDITKYNYTYINNAEERNNFSYNNDCTYNINVKYNNNDCSSNNNIDINYNNTNNINNSSNSYNGNSLTAINISPSSYNFDSKNPDEKLIEIINNITGTFLKNTSFTEDFLKRLPQMQKEFLERRALQIEVFGSLKPLSKDEYERVYQSTGIDLDGRKEHLLEELPHIERSIKRYISFAKTIPGFNELCISDQITLIKASKFEAWMIFCHKLFNVEHMLYTTQSGKVAHVDDMKRMKNCEFLDAMFHLEGYLQRMQLSVEETCIMGAVCVMFPDTCNLQDPHLVEKSQNLVLECLYYLFRKYHPEDKLRFAHFISCVLQMRTLKEIQMREEEAFVMEWGGKVEIPKLVYEIWSS